MTTNPPRKSKYFYANIRKIQFARLVDDAFLLTLSMIVYFTFSDPILWVLAKFGFNDFLYPALCIAPIMAVILDHFIYEPICLIKNEGTPGQRILGLRVVDEDTKVRPNFSEVSRMVFFRAVFSVPLIFGLLMGVWQLVIPGILLRAIPYFKFSRNARGQNFVEKNANLIILQKHSTLSMPAVSQN